MNLRHYVSIALSLVIVTFIWHMFYSVGFADTPSFSHAKAIVRIEDFNFFPNLVIIEKGTTVTWINKDSLAHKIKSELFNSSPLSQGQSFSFTFLEEGEYEYHCSIYPSMKGKISVGR